MRLVFKIVFLYFCVFPQLKAEEIIVLKTRSLPMVENILKGFQSVCQKKHAVTVFDMEGNLYTGNDILDQINDKIDQKNIKAIFTIGLPATQLILKSVKQLPVFFTMVSDSGESTLFAENISGISKDIPADIQLQTLKETLPHARRIAIIYSQQYSVNKARQLLKAADKYPFIINLYQVGSIKEIPKTLRRVIKENDGLILLPDKIVMNQASLEYFVSMVMENEFPVLSYNEYLVKSGILMGLSPNYLLMGQQAGDSLCSSTNRLVEIQQPKYFRFFVNSKAVSTINKHLVPNLIDLADYVY